MEVAMGGICVGIPTAGITVFVGNSAGLLFMGATVTDSPQARLAITSKQRNRKIFFMGVYPFMLDHSHKK
jgi:hypothetical protein